MDQIAPSPSHLLSLGLSVADYFLIAFALYIFILICYVFMRLLLKAIDLGLNWCFPRIELGGQLDLEAGQSVHGRDDKETLDRPESRNEKVLLEAHGTNVDRFFHDGCVICLEEFRKGEACRVLDCCNHIFHPKCIYKWLGKSMTCPICRKSIDLDGIREYTV